MKVIMHDLFQKPVRRSESKIDSPFQKGTSATLLVVDDEPIMRDIEVQALAREGYQVLSAAGPAEALRLAAVTSTIDLLLTDYSMPEVNGVELVRRFRRVHPKTPVLMVSGSMEMLNGAAANLERFETLAKPFTAKELVQKVRTLLNGVLRSQ
ncbi:MAG: response regulator [Verrucomicrobia bacterium]|nr:response regulator [Verrucomicrobiota bacterium]